MATTKKSAAPKKAPVKKAAAKKAAPKKNPVVKRRRAVIVAGVRTPFVKAFGEFMKLDTIALGTAAVNALLERTELPRKELDGIRWGGVVLPGYAPNIGREIVIDTGLPRDVEAMTVTRACASGLQAITSAVETIERGDADVMIAGGSDSTSNAEIKLPQKLVHALAPLAFGKASPADILGILSQLMPISEILPQRPKIAERSTGQVMGESAEDMARRHGITREAQDAFAVQSHKRAAAAIASGRFDREVVSVKTERGIVHTDGLVRGDTSVEAIARLRPVFAKDGTLTAANSSPLTDGASAVLIMSEEKAHALGMTPLAAFRSWSYVGVDPADQLLIGPAIAIPRALDRAGLSLGDVDFVDIHEAFAAQVLCVLKMLESDAWAKERLGKSKAVGAVDSARLNIHGGSVAIGHPFAATGARMVTTMANELHMSGKETAVLGICAAGGLGAAAVMERV
ncbi:MAG: acetyl-CoA acyltransferase [Myxococcota bacterium]|jgi:acetyl-CoA acyltransferase